MSTEEIRANIKRCNGILECRDKIRYWKAKLEVLEEEQELCIKLARLRLDAQATWKLLSRHERTEKKFILAALESNELPEVLEEFSNGSFPPHIRLDRDILMARVTRNDFVERFSWERLFVPPRLRNDKEVIMTIIPNHPQVIENMSFELRDDKDVLRALLARKQRPPAFFLQHFSDRLRADKDTMLEILRHPDGMSALAFCSLELRNEKDFCLEAIALGDHTVEPQALRYASQRLRDDFDVVYSAVCKSGMNLKHASYAMRRDEQIVMAASDQNPKSFRYCLPGSVKEELLEDREFALRVVQFAPNSIKRSCMELYQSDEEIILRAVANGLEWCGIPENLQVQTDFVIKVMQRNPEVYMSLPEKMQQTFEVAMQIVKWYNFTKASDGVILEAIGHCPELLSNREAMMYIAQNGRSGVLVETLPFSPLEIRNDKSIMMEAVKNNSISFEYCSVELRQDRDVVLAAVEKCPNSLFHTEDSFQLEHPDIVIRAIEKSDTDDLWSTYNDIVTDLWSIRDVAMAWISRGGAFLTDDFPEDFADDKELLLTLICHNWSEFERASDEVKNDKDFMLRVVAVDGRAIRDVSEDLRYDEDLLMAAISNDPRALQFYSGGADFEFMVSFSQRVRDQLWEYEIFEKEILGNISLPSCGTESTLPMLNQGPDTLVMYEEKLSSYLGILQGDKIAQFASNSKHLFSFGF
jgi:hypothetical protein